MSGPSIGKVPTDSLLWSSPGYLAVSGAPRSSSIKRHSSAAFDKSSHNSGSPLRDKRIMNTISFKLVQSVKGARINPILVQVWTLLDVVRCREELQLSRRHHNQHSYLSHRLVLGRRVGEYGF